MPQRPSGTLNDWSRRGSDRGGGVDAQKFASSLPTGSRIGLRHGYRRQDDFALKHLGIAGRCGGPSISLRLSFPLAGAELGQWAFARIVVYRQITTDSDGSAVSTVYVSS
jgi:hypothetical protein